MSKKTIKNQSQPNHNQYGLASIVVVLMLMIVITLISLGFSKLMDRATQQALGNNLNASADYAARSGINDVVALLQAYPNTTASTCSSLLVPGQPFSGKAAQLSGNNNTRYTCILIDKNPTELVYQNTEAFKSQVVTITPTKATANLMFSWQATDRNLNAFPANGQKTLLDETSWGINRYAPALRISLYRVKTDLKLNTLKEETYFLYPNQKNSNSVTVVNENGTASGSLKTAACGATDTGGFSGSADYDCNVILTGLDTGQTYYYFIRLTPLYANADLKIKGNDAAGQPLDFGATQYTIDVTAKSGNSVKRLQARVNAPNFITQSSLIGPADDAFPEYALRSAITICKRLMVNNDDNTVTIESNSAAYCALPIPAQPPPCPSGYSGTYPNCVPPPCPSGYSGTYPNCIPPPCPSGYSGAFPNCIPPPPPPPNPVLSFSASSNSIAYNGSTTLHWRISNGPATWCWASGGWSGWRNPAGGDEGTGNLTTSTTYSLQCGNNSPGYNDYHTPTQNVTVTVGSRPRYTLTITFGGQGGGNVYYDTGKNCPNTACVITYNAGDTVSLFANTDSDSRLRGWSNPPCSNRGNPCSFTINSDITVKAYIDLR